MRPRIHRAPCLRISLEVSFLTEGMQEDRAASRPGLAALEVGVARCPRCQMPLVARMGCQGPYFHCHCYESRVPGYHRKESG
jgi:hypothetical protein